MKRLSAALVLGVGLLPAFGFTHCEEGHRVAFGRSGEMVPLVVATRHVAGPNIDLRLSVTVYSNGLATVARDEAGNEMSRSVQVDPAALLELHAALVAGGAAQLRGPLEDTGFVASRSRHTVITFLEPWLPPSKAWSNTFSFANDPVDDRAHEVWEVLETFVEVHFGRLIFRE